MKNILVVFTGGTIGSVASEGVIDTAGAASFQLIRQFQARGENRQRVRLTPIEPLRLLSENLAPAAWQTLIAAIEAQQPGAHDGIIITHGTDTLAYTAAALSFYFHALEIPLLLVSSDYPLDDVRANGLDNFICAVEFIRQQGLAGVFVPYRNQGQATQVHKGSRLACSLQLSGDFFSVRGKSFMRYENGRFSAADALDNTAGGDKTLSLKAEFSGRVLMIRPYPGLNYAHFNLDGVDAVLHDLYHSGTACASAQWGENYSLVAFIKRCRERHVKVYLAPSIKSADAYQSTRTLMAQGAEMIWNMSIEAAYAKLMLAYGNFGDARSIMAFIDRDIAGEHLA